MNYASRFSEDAEFISEFISEVGRIEDTKLAIAGKGSAPTGNWIHSFSDFKGVIDVLAGQLFSSTPIDELCIRRLLYFELKGILTRSLIKSSGKLISPRRTVEAFAKACPITQENKLNAFTKVPVANWDHLSFVAIHLLTGKVHSYVVSNVLLGPTFLAFDGASNSYHETEEFSYLSQLQEEIRRFNEANIPQTLQVIYDHSKAKRPQATSVVRVKTIELTTLLYLIDRWVNIIELARYLMKRLNGHVPGRLSLRERSPVEGMHQQIEAEIPSSDEMAAFLQQDN